MFTRRLQLAALPTPLHRLERLSASAGADVWAKRDDLTGYALGGNKVRKAEYLLADALEQGATAVITAGALQSNHARVVAVASSRCGLSCHLVLSGPAGAPVVGNLALDRLAGAAVHRVDTSAEREVRMADLAEQLRRAGERPYTIPVGGSNWMGAQGYAAAAAELAAQLAALPEAPTRVLFATSSGGTAAGLAAGRAATGARFGLLGVRVDRDPDAEAAILGVARVLAERLGAAAPIAAGDIALEEGFVGEGYGVPSAEGQAAVERLWREEGLLLDPVYTAKAIAGLLALAARGAFAGERVVFLHTGGGPALVAER
ncbi:MAG: pyridoxal-phosphate dependent enzyme [Chthonomonadales bacterium]|nr:pyridoxal-phosphate dependent enzyme [Chthonomonadales bacterium]